MSEDAEMKSAAVAALNEMFTAHAKCMWEQVGPCVYCADHHVRLYQGDLPDAKRTTPKCVEHRWDDGDSMSQCGFYFLCLDCGEKEWT